VLRHALGKLANGRKPLRANLVSTYYETDDRALARRGLSLRVREHDGRFVQTVKSIGSGKAGALARGESGKMRLRPDVRIPMGPKLADFLSQGSSIGSSRYFEPRSGVIS